MSYTQSLGKVSVVVKGTWNNAATYERLDIVKHNGGSYIAIQDVPIGRPVTDTDYWMALADKGDTGDDGNGIASIVKTGSIGLVDYYTITYTDGTTTSMNITNGDKGDTGEKGDTGNGIASVELLSTAELSKTYRMTFTNGDYFDYVVNDGETDISNAVRFDTAQSKTDAEKATAQSNIGMGNVVADVDKLKDDSSFLEEAIFSTTGVTTVNPELTYSMGYVHGLSYDNPHASTNTIYSNLIEAEKNVINYSIQSGYKALIVEYDSNNEYKTMGAWLTGTGTRTLNNPYYCVEIRNSESSAIDESAGEEVTISYEKEILPSKRNVINITSDSTTMLTITESCDINGNGHTIAVGQNYPYALQIMGNIEVNVSNLILTGGTSAACRVSGYALANFKQCEFKNSQQHGLATSNGSTNCVDCIATGNAIDGFNYHLTGKNTAVSCWAYDNGDDGISNHEQSSLKIIGGRFYNNGKAGIACPTYGAGNTDIHGAFIHDNTQYGLLIFSESQTTETVYVEGCLIKSNPKGVRVCGYQAIMKGVVFSGNTQDKEIISGGTITEF